MLFTQKCSNVHPMVFVFILFFMSAATFATENAAKESGDKPVSSELANAIFAKLRQARPQLTFSDLKHSPIEGVYEVQLNGRVVFVSADGGHLIAGDMYRVESNNLVNLQEIKRKQAEVALEPERAKQLSSLQADDMVVYSPEGEPKGHVYVFTDIDCGFCRRLHGQMAQMLSLGIEVRYLAFPRAGVHSGSARKLETTWCADDPQQAMNVFKEGGSLPLQSCDKKSVIAQQYSLGQKIGVRGTPAIVLASGKIIPGAVSPDYLAEQMGL